MWRGWSERRAVRRTCRVALLAALVWALALPSALAAFKATLARSSTFATLASAFPDYPTQVKATGPQFLHRGEQEPSAAVTSQADDAITSPAPSPRHGTYTSRTNGPAVWWKLDEGSGTSVTDRAGSTISGTVGGNPAWTAGRTGQALQFDGNGDYVQGRTRAVDASTAYSATAWVKLSDATLQRAVVSQPSNASAPGGNQSAFTLRWQAETGTTGHWEFLRHTSDTATTPSSVVVKSSLGASAPVGQWVHLAATYAPASGMVLYVNGNLMNTLGPSAGIQGNGQLQVGRSWYNAGWTDQMHGAIDDVRVYNRALSGSEVSDIYAGRHDGMVSAWGFDDSYETVAGMNDRSGHANTLAVAGGRLEGISTGAPVKRGRQSLFLDGSPGNHAYGSRSVLRTDQSFTVMAWVAMGADSGSRVIVSQDGAVASAFALEFRDDSRRFSFTKNRTDAADTLRDTASSTTIVTVSSPSTSPVWYHVAGVYDAVAQRLRLYVNGVQEDAEVPHSSGYDASGVMQVGRGKSQGTYQSPFMGWIDDVRVLQRPLGSIEVSDHMNDSVSAGQASALQGGALQGPQQGLSGSTAVAYSGMGATSGGYNPTTYSNPQNVSVECWFRTTSTHGGVLAQFADTGTGMPSIYDRLLYLGSDGLLRWGTYRDTAPAGHQVLQASPSVTNGFRDGSWHHVVGTLSSTGGMALYVDGVLVASDASWTTAQNTLGGVWRWGNGAAGGWPGRPTSDGFIGSIDEVAVYGSALSAQQVSWNYHANY